MQLIFTASAPQAIGPYAQAIRTGELLYCSGQTPIDPATMLIQAATIEEQTKQVIMNLELIFQGAGPSLKNVIKTNVFLADMSLFASMNTYAACLGTHQPARSTIAVKGLPYDAMVEIECVAEFN